MDRKDLIKTYLRISKLAGAPGKEHERLRGDLKLFAESDGYETSYRRFANGDTPDVLMSTKKKDYLFVGDAKDSANETTENSETIRRIENYIFDFAEWLSNTHKGGTIAIATNDRVAAHQWKIVLQFITRKIGLINEEKEHLCFTVSKLRNRNTWIIHG